MSDTPEVGAVDALQALYGKHPGFRANHAKGIVLEGTFTPTAEAAFTLKSQAGSLASLDANSSSATWLLLFDAASAPADGVVTPIWSGQMLSGRVDQNWPTPLAFANGCIAAFSSTGPFVKTSGPTGFISAQVA